VVNLVAIVRGRVVVAVEVEGCFLLVVEHRVGADSFLEVAGACGRFPGTLPDPIAVIRYVARLDCIVRLYSPSLLSRSAVSYPLCSEPIPQA